MKRALFVCCLCLLVVATGCCCKKKHLSKEIAVTGVTVSPATLSLTEGETKQLIATVAPENASEKEVTWESSSITIATVDENGIVTAVKAGNATITVTTVEGGKTATCEVSVDAAIPAFVAVDLGLSVKWANKNIGADFPEEYGNYYAWGETEPKDTYTWDKYKFWGGGQYITKYSTSSYVTINPDYLTILEEGDDVAHKVLGGNWRMPTAGEWEELRSAMKWQTGQKGVTGKASNGNEIFLPFAGMYSSNNGASLYLEGKEGYFWTSSLCADSPSGAYFAMYPGGLAVYNQNRCYGLSVRAVYGERPATPVAYINIDPVNKEVEIGEQFTITATILPASATDKTIIWSSSNEAAATVVDGVVTAVGAGEAIITAKAGGKESGCTVTIKNSAPTINATAEDLGKVIGANGTIYANSQAAASAGTAAAAIIVYVGSETAEDGFAHGLAMSMRDCSNTSGYKWKTSSGSYDNPQRNDYLHTLLGYKESGKSLTTSDRDNDTWPAFKAALNNSISVAEGITATAPGGTSGWFLPSMFQWQQAIHAMTGKTTEISLYTANSDYVNDKFNAKIVDTEGHLGKLCYASSSEFDSTYNWHFDFNEGIARRNAKWCDYTVRAFLAF